MDFKSLASKVIDVAFRTINDGTRKEFLQIEFSADAIGEIMFMSTADWEKFREKFFSLCSGKITGVECNISINSNNINAKNLVAQFRMDNEFVPEAKPQKEEPKKEEKPVEQAEEPAPEKKVYTPKPSTTDDVYVERLEGHHEASLDDFKGETKVFALKDAIITSSDKCVMDPSTQYGEQAFECDALHVDLDNPEPVLVFTLIEGFMHPQEHTIIWGSTINNFCLPVKTFVDEEGKKIYGKVAVKNKNGVKHIFYMTSACCSDLAQGFCIPEK